jgi:hypothetical protein
VGFSETARIGGTKAGEAGIRALEELNVRIHEASIGADLSGIPLFSDRGAALPGVPDHAEPDHPIG